MDTVLEEEDSQYDWASDVTNAQNALEEQTITIRNHLGTSWTITPVVKFKCTANSPGFRGRKERPSMFRCPYSAVSRCRTGWQAHYSFHNMTQ